jgi:hypothetical protein
VALQENRGMGIQIQMNVTDPGAENWLRRWWSWLLLPPIAWFISIPFLGGGAFFLPVVIGHAPLGIIAYFDTITVTPKPSQSAIIAVIHVGFWTLFLTGFALRHVLPIRWLRTIWIVLAVALFMSVSGCAVQLGPGLRNQGNWH